MCLEPAVLEREENLSDDEAIEGMCFEISIPAVFCFILFTALHFVIEVHVTDTQLSLETVLQPTFFQIHVVFLSHDQECPKAKA